MEENHYGIAEIFLHEPMEHGTTLRVPINRSDPSDMMLLDFGYDLQGKYDQITETIDHVMPWKNSDSVLGD